MRHIQYRYDYQILTIILKDKEPRQSESMNLGTLDAKLTKQYFEEYPNFREQLILFGENLAKQRGCDAIQLFSIGFREINYSNK